MASDVTQQDQVQQTEIVMRKSCIKSAELVRRQESNWDDPDLEKRYFLEILYSKRYSIRYSIDFHMPEGKVLQTLSGMTSSLRMSPQPRAPIHRLPPLSGRRSGSQAHPAESKSSCH